MRACPSPTPCPSTTTASGTRSGSPPSPERALAAARETRLEDAPLVKALVLAARASRARRGSFWDALRADGFQQLGDDTVVLVGKPWILGGGRRAVDDFVAFAEPGCAKMAIDLRAEPDGDGSRLETETRVFLTDLASRRRFAAYWLVVRPFSGLMRRSWFRAARRRAET